MDGQQYLNQISEMSQPVRATSGKKGISGILSSKFFIVGAIGVGLLVLIMIIGALMGGGKAGEKEQSIDLKLHLDNVVAVIDEYQPNVRSSALRSYSASLRGVLSNTSNGVTSYLTDAYGFKDKDISKAMREEAQLAQDELINELFEAKINGILDRIYAHKMAYEVSMLMTEEEKLSNTSRSEELKKVLSDSYNSLNNLYSNFNDFSETNY